jgi:hypothetical protein
MRLTDTHVRNAKPRAKAYKLSDGGGMYMLVPLLLISFVRETPANASNSPYPAYIVRSYWHSQDRNDFDSEFLAYSCVTADGMWNLHPDGWHPEPNIWPP